MKQSIDVLSAVVMAALLGNREDVIDHERAGIVHIYIYIYIYYVRDGVEVLYPLISCATYH